MLCSYSMLRSLILFLGMLISVGSLAQKHQWMSIAQNAVGTVSTGYAPRQVVDPDNNIYTLGSYRGSIFFPADTITFQTPNSFCSYIAKYKPDGTNAWVKNITSGQSAVVVSMKMNKKNQIVLYGFYFNANVNPLIFGSDTLRLNRAVFIALMDTSGNFISGTDIAFGGAAVNSFAMALASNDDIVVTGYHSFGTKCLYDSGRAVNVTLSCCDAFLARYSSTGRTLRWHRSFPVTQLSPNQALAVDKNDQIYMGFQVSASQTGLGVSAGSTNRAALAWYRGDGTLYKARGADDNNMVAIESVSAIDSNFVFCAASVRNDSSSWNGRKFYKQGTVRPSIRTFNVAFALRSWDSILWLHTTNFCSNYTPTDLAFSDIGQEFIYLSLQTTTTGADTFRFGGLSGDINTPSKLCKLDLRGNVLWILSCPSTYAAPINTIGNGDVVYSGISSRTGWTFDPFSYSRTLNAQWNFIARTFDYSIVRGNIRSGPYCAGDTFLVPYTKTGDYDTSNVFIAELSDEKGEFLGKERELGRIKTNTDSTVIGILPLFQVASSPLYRIRIRSTHPVVQSFYRLDTLRLLIYSRDKADPGPDTSICSGQPFTLNTFGGTSWLWSPNVNMDNPRLRTPTVRPDTSTTYTIVISDSSGCGAPDTASIRISIKDSLRITGTSLSDSLACLGQSVTYSAWFGGGLPSGYLASWFSGSRLLARRPASSGSDSLQFTFRGDTLIYVVLSDSCSSVNDTSWFRTRLFNPVSQVQFPRDTLLCLGEEITLKTHYLHAKPDSIRLVWKRPAGNLLVGTGDSIPWTGGIQTQIEVELLNSCNNERLTGSFDLFTRPAWNLEIDLSGSPDSLCFGTEHRFSPQRSGGKSGPGMYAWSINGLPFSTDSSLVINTDQFYQTSGSRIQSLDILLRGSDQCSKPEGIDSIRLYLLPPVQLTRNQDSVFTACYGNIYPFKSNVQGGINFNSITYNWWLEGNLVSNQDSFILNSAQIYNQWGDTPIQLLQVAGDQCSRNDSLFFELSITTPPQIEIDLASDTLSVCNGTDMWLTTQKSGGRTDSTILEWQWENATTWWSGDSLYLSFNKGFNTSDSLRPITVRYFDPCAPSFMVYDSVFIRILNSPVISFENDSLAFRQILDTVLCLGQAFEVNAQTFYVSPSSTVTWYLNGDSVGRGSRFSMNNSLYNLRVSDQLLLMAVLKDECTVFMDTATFDIRVRPDLVLSPLPDTLVCFGSTLRLEAMLTGGFATQYQYRWINEATGITISAQKELELPSIEQALRIRLETSDQCSDHRPEQLIRVTVLDPLEVTLLSSDTCFVNSASLQAIPGGGNGKYQFSWYENNILLSDQNAQLTVQTTRTSDYMVILSDQCSEPEDTAIIRVGPLPDFELISWDTIACEPFVPLYTVRSIHGEDYSYFLKDGSADLNGQSLDAGNYSLILQALSELGCSTEIVLNLRVKPLPEAGFSYTPEDPSFDNPEVRFISDMPGLDAYTWFLNNATISTQSDFLYRFSDTGSYQVKLLTELEGCENESEQWLRFRDNFRYYRISAFSPNGDGLNDRYQPVAFGIESGFYTVYNRWGGIVFQGNTDAVWDGTYQGAPVAAGTYQVMIQLIDRQGKRSFIQERLEVMR